MNSQPENVLLVDKTSYDIKIADFGLSNIVGDQGAQLATACGTPDYVAPEVLKGDGYNQAVDMWAVGVLAYILVSQRKRKRPTKKIHNQLML